MSSSTTKEEELINAYLNAPLESAEGGAAVQSIVHDMKKKTTSFLDIVSLLGAALTHKDPFHRARAVHLMYDILKALDYSEISVGEAKVLAAFFNDKLADQPSVSPALNALFILLQSGTLDEASQMSVAQRIFAELNVQTYGQAVRNVVFRILAHLLSHSLNIIKSNSSDFIVGFIHCLDGEKDPRNLLLAFRMVLRIIQTLDFEPYKEDLFEVVFCYFPITFRAPPDDPHGVTAAELKEALRSVVASTPLFAPFSLPVLIEKLTADSASAKRDALDTLAACAPIYDPECWTPHLSAIWNTIRDVVVNGIDEDSDTSALKALTALTKAVSRALVVLSQKMNSPLNELIDKVCKDCLGQLEEPELKYTRPCGKLVHACALASPDACEKLSSMTIPVLIDLLRNENTDVRRKILLEILVDMIHANRTALFVKSNTQQNVAASTLAQQKNDCFDLIASFLVMDSSYAPLRVLAIRGIQELMTLNDVFSEEQLILGARQISHAGFTPLKNSSVADESLIDSSKAALGALIEIRENLIISIALSEFKSSLNVNSYKPIFQILSHVGILDKGFIPVSSLLMEVVSHSGSPEIVHGALIALADIISAQKPSPERSQFILDTVLHPLLRLCKSHMGLSQEAGCHQLLRSCAIALDAKQQEALIKDIIDSKNDIELMTSENGAAIPASPSAMILFGSIFCFLRSSIVLPVSIRSIAFPISLIKYALIDREDQDLFETAGQIIASLVNKSLSSTEVDELLEGLKQASEIPFLTNPDADINVRKGLLLIHFWVARALVLKYDPKGYGLVEEIITRLGDPQLGAFAANGFEILFGDNEPGVLTRKSYSQVKLLYKQRLYDRCLPQIVDGFKNDKQDFKVYYLTALSFMLRNISKAVLLSELSKLFPLLLHSLSIDNASLKLATLETLVVMIQELPSLVEKHLKSFLDQFLAISIRISSQVSRKTLDPSSDVKMVDADSIAYTHDPRVRVAALKSLGLLVDAIPYASLFPYKSKVLTDLERALDDPKRVVRSQAAHTRNKWFLLLGPQK